MLRILRGTRLRAFIISIIFFLACSSIAEAEDQKTPVSSADIMQLQLAGMPSTEGNQNTDQNPVLLGGIKRALDRIAAMIGRQVDSDTAVQYVAESLNVDKQAQTLVEQKRRNDLLAQKIGKSVALEKASLAMTSARLTQAEQQLATLSKKSMAQSSALRVARHNEKLQKLQTRIENLKARQAQSSVRLDHLNDQMENLGTPFGSEDLPPTLNPVAQQDPVDSEPSMGETEDDNDKVESSASATAKDRQPASSESSLESSRQPASL